MTTRVRAFAHIKRVDTRLHKAVARYIETLPQELKVMTAGNQLFDALCSIVISQQLGSAAADTIYARVKKACGGKITVASVEKVRTAKLRAAGLSGSKAKTLKAIAQAIKTKNINLTKLGSLAAEDAKSRLTEIWGIGPWSADMFLIFSLGHPDVFSPGDLGLIRAVEKIYALPKNAPIEKIVKISEHWIPYRTYASLALWKTRDNAPRTVKRGHR